MWWLRLSAKETEEMWAAEREAADLEGETAHYEALAAEHWKQMEAEYNYEMILDHEYGPVIHQQ